MLIQHFADTRNILNQFLRQRLERDGVWSAEAATGILIESIHKWRPELTQSRPAIILQEGEWQWMRVGIGDRRGEDYRSGKRFFGGYWKGSHTLFALGNEGAEALILATEVMKVLLWYGAEIASQLELQRFVPVSIGKVSALKEATENYVVPVSVAYVVPEFWYLQPEAPRLKQIVFKTSEVLGSY